MVIQPSILSKRRRGSLMMELLMAIALLTGALMPIAYSIAAEKRLARSYYERAVAMEIVDGEIEVLLAGEWRAFETGTHAYPIRAGAATNLPPGNFWLTVNTNKIRLAWQPALTGHGGPVLREAVVK